MGQETGARDGGQDRSVNGRGFCFFVTIPYSFFNTEFMWWQYLLVFLGGFLVDVFPIPLPPAFTVMILLQITFHLDIWVVLFCGVTGSILGRYVLAFYIPKISGKIFSDAKNKDVQFLGDKLKDNRKKGMLFILIYSLMPLPTTPLFVAGGMARMKPMFMILPFIVGKLASDAAALFTGDYAAKNADELLHGLASWKSILGVVLCVLLIALLLFLDWQKLLQEKKFSLKFRIWRKKEDKEKSSTAR